MQLKKYLQIKLPAIAAILLAFGLSSCGSYQYVGQSSDGIYQEDEKVTVVTADRGATDDNNYYKNYFKEKSLEMENDGTNEVFVDVDSYSSSYSDEAGQQENYGGWGQDNEVVTVNVYDNGNWGYWNNWGWNNWGWNRPFGWNRGFGIYGGYGFGGFGFGGFYDPFWCPPFYGYGYGFNNLYYGGFYGRNGYGRYAYNSSRRGSVYGRNSAISRRLGQVARPNRVRSTRTRTTTTRPRVRTNNSKPRIRTNNSKPRVRTNNSKPRVRTSTPRTRTRTSAPSRNYSSPSRSSSSSRGGSFGGSRGSSRGRR